MKKWYLAFIALFLFFSCDILRPEPFEVAGWSPGDGYRDPNGGTVISVQFSLPPDKGSVERSFEFSENGVKLGGRTVWSGDKMNFIPSLPPQYNRDYAIIINTDAQDTRGVSLEKRFEGSWTTRPVEDRPAIIATFPGDNEVIEPGYTKAVIEFSTAVSINSCNNHVSFNPQIGGSWTLDSSGKKAVFTPDAVWKYGTAYKMTVDADFESFAGDTLGKARIVYFTIGGETVPPEITAVAALNEKGEPVERGGKQFTLTELFPDNAEWESGYKVLFRFSEDVDVLSFKKSVSVEPTLSFEVEPKQAFADAIILSFTERPVFNCRYLLKAGAGIKDKTGNESTEVKTYPIRTNGAKSKPPELKRLGITSGGRSVFYEIGDNFNTLVVANDDKAAVTLWFDMAAGAQINLYSLMECFGVSSTNSALTFRPSSIGYGAADGTGSFSAVITGSLTSRDIERGVVTVSVAAGLLDTYGNRQGEGKSMVLLK
jgi:hypothetical protein